jgi:hypothetical protein
VTVDEPSIASAERALLTIRFDGQTEPEFVGLLAVEIIALGPQGNSLGQITTFLEVIHSEHTHVSFPFKETVERSQRSVSRHATASISRMMHDSDVFAGKLKLEMPIEQTRRLCL